MSIKFYMLYDISHNSKGYYWLHSRSLNVNCCSKAFNIVTTCLSQLLRFNYKNISHKNRLFNLFYDKQLYDNVKFRRKLIRLENILDIMNSKLFIVTEALKLPYTAIYFDITTLTAMYV